MALGSWRRIHELAPEQQRAWLFTVARRLLGRYLRRAKVERKAIHRLGMQLPQPDQEDLQLVEQRAGLADLRETLRHQLARLSAGQQEALRRRVLEEQSYEEMAIALGISEQSARARVSRGLRALSSALEPHQAAQERMLLDRATPGGAS